MYIKLAFVSITMLSALKWSNLFESLSSIYSLLQLIIVLCLPVFYTLVLYRNQNVLQHTSIYNTIGSLYLGLRYRTSMQLAYTIIFLIRRLLFVLLLVTFEDRPLFLVSLILFMNVLYISYCVDVHPNNS